MTSRKKQFADNRKVRLIPAEKLRLPEHQQKLLGELWDAQLPKNQHWRLG